MVPYKVVRELVDTVTKKRYVIELKIRGSQGEIRIMGRAQPRVLAECHFDIAGHGAAVVSAAHLRRGAPMGLRAAMLTFLEEVGPREEKIRRIEVRRGFGKTFLVSRGFKFLGSRTQRTNALLEKAKERDMEAKERGRVRDTVSEAKKSIEYIKRRAPLRETIEFIKPITPKARKMGFAKSQLRQGWAWEGAAKRRRIR